MRTSLGGRPQLLHDVSVRLYLLLQRERGQTMAEYAIVLAVIAIGIVVALTALKGSINGALSKVTADI
jgi:Flp pilus assembly pilin Flp